MAGDAKRIPTWKVGRLIREAVNNNLQIVLNCRRATGRLKFDRGGIVDDDVSRRGVSKLRAKTSLPIDRARARCKLQAPR